MILQLAYLLLLRILRPVSTDNSEPKLAQLMLTSFHKGKTLAGHAGLSRKCIYPANGYSQERVMLAAC